MTNSNTALVPTLDPRTQRRSVAADAANARIRDIAIAALAETGGRATYSWEGNGIRVSYLGDNADGSYGESTREYLRGERWAPTSPLPSSSGTGLLNLNLEHVRGCEDPIVKAKVAIIWELLDPALDMADYVITNHRSGWSNITAEPRQILDALAQRLNEVLEQKVLENPGAGLDLHLIAAGRPATGWVEKNLDAAVFNLMRRLTGTKVTTTSWAAADSDEFEDGLHRVTEAAMPIASAEDTYIETSADAAALDAAVEFERASKGMRHAARTRLAALTILEKFHLPFLHLPATPERKAMAAALDEDPGIAVRSLEAYYCLITGAPIASHLLLGDDWLEIWREYDVDAAGQMLALHVRQQELVYTVVAGSLAQ